MEGLFVIRDNIQWRVGNRKTIREQTDPWLPGLNPYIKSELPEDLRNITISTLIDTEGGWDGDLIRDIFNQRDANLI